MTQPSKFILNSDFPTLKNDALDAAQFNIPGSQVIPAAGTLGGFSDISMGKIGSVIRGRIASTKNDDIFYSGNSIIFNRVGTVGGTPGFNYGLACFMYRISASDVRFQIFIVNPYGADLTTEAGTDIVTMQANTFITPFS